MASTYKSDAVQDYRPAPTATAADVLVPAYGVIDLADTGALVVNDVLRMVKLPANHVPVDFLVDTDELDTGADAIVIDAGLSDANNNEFISGSTVGQAGGIARMDQTGGARIAPSTSDRDVGVKVTTGPGTGATTGKIAVVMLCRPVSYGA